MFICKYLHRHISQALVHSAILRIEFTAVVENNKNVSAINSFVIMVLFAISLLLAVASNIQPAAETLFLSFRKAFAAH